MTSTHNSLCLSTALTESLWVITAADLEGQPEGDSPNLPGLLVPGANLQATFPQHPRPWGGEGQGNKRIK